MSRIDLKPQRLPSKSPLPARCAWALAALASVLISATHLHAQATVLTLGGGAIVKPYSGYIDGNTLTTAKFSQPSGMALDPSGSYLFVADYTNNAVRLLSQLGSSSGTTTTFANVGKGVSHPLAVVVDGATNVYVLNHGSGNIGSKLVQHISRANAYGQILLGLDRPAADVSRGSTTHDILGVAAIVGVQSIAYNILYPEAGQRLPGE